MKKKTETRTEVCLKCGEKFEDVNFISSLPLAKRLYCNKCVKEMN